MSEIETPMSADRVEWKFQVERDGFITRYGITPHFFYKQVLLQPGHMIPAYPIKLITRRMYETAKNLSEILE